MAERQIQPCDALEPAARFGQRRGRQRRHDAIARRDHDQGRHADLRRHDAPAADGGGVPAGLELGVGSIDIEDAHIVWNDASTGSRWELTNFALTAEDFGVGERFPLQMQFALAGADVAVQVAADMQATLALATAIIDVAALGFLGLGPQDPATPEWGTMLTDTTRYLQTAPHLAIIPGVAIIISVLGFNLIGDGLREALDPKLRGRG